MINFYRDSFCSDANLQVVNYCKTNDRMAMLRHLFNQDYQHPSCYGDELVNNRYGMNAILDILRTEKNRRICDVACGNGQLLRRIKSMGHDVVGIDVSPIRVLLNQRAIRMILAFLEEIPFPDNEFDFVIAQECLEHAMDLEKSLAEIRRITKIGGSVLCQVPLNTESDGANHVRFFSEEKLEFVFKATGFQVEFVKLIPYLHGQCNNNIFLKAVK